MRRTALAFTTVLAGVIAVAGAWGSAGALRMRLAVEAASPVPFGIYRVDPGGKPVRLSSGRDDAFPAWSPDGKSIAFVHAVRARNPDRGCRLVVVAATGRASRAVPGVTAACRAISWGRNDLIAFNDPKGAVWVVKADGTGLRKVVRPVSNSTGPGQVSLNPAWSPDGRTIAFGNGISGGLYAVGANGRGVHQLTKPPFTMGDGFPAWSPNGKMIAFIRTNPADFSISIMVARSDGSGAKRLLKLISEGDLVRPAWTADGTSIVFGDLYGISIVSTSGGSTRLLVPGHYDQPAVAPPT